MLKLGNRGTGEQYASSEFFHRFDKNSDVTNFTFSVT